MATTTLPPGTAEDPPTLAPAVRSSLAALRGRVRWYVCLEGLACGATWLGVAFWISLVVDWFFEPPVWVRGAILAVVAAVLAAVLVKMIALRAFVRMSNSKPHTLRIVGTQINQRTRLCRPVKSVTPCFVEFTIVVQGFIG